MGKVKEAYDVHKVQGDDQVPGPARDTFETMKRLRATLRIDVDEGELAQVVERHLWENIPEGKKGEGKLRRKAKPGGWREDLTPEQAEVVERITSPLLEELYYEVRSENPSKTLPLGRR
jgi:hypothetical protein